MPKNVLRITRVFFLLMTTSSSELKRSLSMSQLIFMGLVFIGPLAPIGIFGTLDA